VEARDEGLTAPAVVDEAPLGLEDTLAELFATGAFRVETFIASAKGPRAVLRTTFHLDGDVITHVAHDALEGEALTHALPAHAARLAKAEHRLALFARIFDRTLDRLAAGVTVLVSVAAAAWRRDLETALVTLVVSSAVSYLAAWAARAFLRRMVARAVARGLGAAPR
jgi:hypothetical protein